MSKKKVLYLLVILIIAAGSILLQYRIEQNRTVETLADEICFALIRSSGQLSQGLSQNGKEQRVFIADALLLLKQASGLAGSNVSKQAGISYPAGNSGSIDALLKVLIEGGYIHEREIRPLTEMIPEMTEAEKKCYRELERLLSDAIEENFATEEDGTLHLKKRDRDGLNALLALIQKKVEELLQ